MILDAARINKRISFNFIILNIVLYDLCFVFKINRTKMISKKRLEIQSRYRCIYFPKYAFTFGWNR